MTQRGEARLPRRLHPAAWWLWAIGLAAAASRTTNPLLLLLFCAVAGLVVSVRRSDAPWARGFRFYVILGLVIVVIRVVFRALFGGQFGTTELFALPELSLPDAVSGISIGGPVTLEGVLAAVYDALRVATLLICLGAANSLADAKRLLKMLPAALYEVGVAVTIALTVAPQLIESAQRIRRARKLRGGARPGVGSGIVIPVLDDALDRSLVLAAAMDARGYGRNRTVSVRARRVTGGLLLAGVLGLAIGTYGVLDATTPRWIGAPLLAAGCAMALLGLRASGRRQQRTIYRPDPWRTAETIVAACGIGAAALMFLAAEVDAANLFPSLQPLRWPVIGPVPAMAALCAALPALVSPPVPSTTDSARRRLDTDRPADRLVGAS